MDSHVAWLLEVAVKPGQFDTFRELMIEMVESTKAEPGAQVYEWAIGDDGSVMHVNERYADSGATLAHLATFMEAFDGRFLDAVDPTRFTVLGSPSDEVKQEPSGFNPAYMRSFGGFSR